MELNIWTRAGNLLRHDRYNHPATCNVGEVYRMHARSANMLDALGCGGVIQSEDWYICMSFWPAWAAFLYGGKGLSNGLSVIKRARQRRMGKMNWCYWLCMHSRVEWNLIRPRMRTIRGSENFMATVQWNTVMKRFHGWNFPILTHVLGPEGPRNFKSVCRSRIHQAQNGKNWLENCTACSNFDYGIHFRSTVM